MELFGIFVPVVDVRGKSPAEARLWQHFQHVTG